MSLPILPTKLYVPPRLPWSPDSDCSGKCWQLAAYHIDLCTSGLSKGGIAAYAIKAGPMAVFRRKVLQRRNGGAMARLLIGMRLCCGKPDAQKAENCPAFKQAAT